jgi:hypothetical protein
MRKLFAVASLLLFTACFHFRYVNTDVPAAPAAQEESWHHGLVWGIAELSPPVEATRVCPNGWAQVEQEETFLNGFTRVLTFSIYAPATTRVYCSAQGKAPQSPSRPWK